MEDPEIEAMMKVSAALASLDEDAVARVLRWAAERYSVGELRSKKGLASKDAGEVSDGSSNNSRYQHFAELFGAANPKTDMEKALVAAYWFQALQAKTSFQSAELNKELKDMGHVIGNITDALSSAQSRKPALVIQLKKSGSSRQARKTYKLTNSGVSAVEAML